MTLIGPTMLAIILFFLVLTSFLKLKAMIVTFEL